MILEGSTEDFLDEPFKDYLEDSPSDFLEEGIIRYIIGGNIQKKETLEEPLE